jgi:hypothetical protein
LIRERIALLGGAIRRSHRIEARGRALVLDAELVRKNGRIASPEAVASSSTKAAKSMAVMKASGGRNGVTEWWGAATDRAHSHCGAIVAVLPQRHVTEIVM